MTYIFNVSENTIGNLFSGTKIYVIPTYQRPYAWEEKHVDALWNDILDTLNQHGKLGNNFPGYFVGAIYTRSLNINEINELYPDLKKRLQGSEDALSTGFEDNNQRKIDFIEVLDGQQRLTTLFLLRQRFGGLLNGMIQLKNGETITSVIPSTQDWDFFLDLVSNNNTPIPATYSQRKLKDTKEYFSSPSLPTGVNDAQISAVVNNLFRVTDHRLLNSDFAIQIFQGQNDRGKKLTYLERLKSLFMLFDHRFCNGKHKAGIQDRFAGLYHALNRSMTLGVFEDGEAGEDECLRVFFVMLRIGYDAEAMWTSIEHIYEGYFKKELAENPDSSLNLWLGELGKMNQALTELNEQMGKIDEYGIVINSLGLSIRSKTLLLQLHCGAYPMPSYWHGTLFSVSYLDEWVENEISKAITSVEQEYTLSWQQANMDGFFTDKVNGLRTQISQLKGAQKDISLLDLVKWLELAVWVGNPKVKFRDRWNFVFTQQKAGTAQGAAQVFWNDLVNGYRNSYLASLLSPYSPRGIEFLLKEVERLGHNGKNLHGIPRNEIHLEHILPQTPSFNVKDVGFSSQDEYENALNSLANLIFIEGGLNGLVSNDPPYLKAQHYIKQQGRDGASVKHIMGEPPPLGNDLDAIHQAAGVSSVLYRACLRLRQIELVLCIAERL